MSPFLRPCWLGLLAACSHGTAGPRPDGLAWPPGRRRVVVRGGTGRQRSHRRNARRGRARDAGRHAARPGGRPLRFGAGGFSARLETVDSTALAGDDARAFGVMRATLARDLGPVALPASGSGAPGSTRPGESPPTCTASAMAARDGRARFAARADLRLLRLGAIPHRRRARHARPALDPWPDRASGRSRPAGERCSSRSRRSGAASTATTRPTARTAG